ncbi:MAG: HD domain-containing protein, partial [Anaerolineae bacterium]
PHLDLLKAVQMALIHDLGEAFVGDLTPQDGIAPAEKHRREAEAVARLLEGLPNAAELFALWQEYEACETPEAQLIRQLDRLEMGLQASVYAREGLLRTPGTFYASAANALHDAPLTSLLDSAAT